jgi:hypothetical protein
MALIDEARVTQAWRSQLSMFSVEAKSTNRSIRETWAGPDSSPSSIKSVRRAFSASAGFAWVR